MKKILRLLIVFVFAAPGSGVMPGNELFAQQNAVPALKASAPVEDKFRIAASGGWSRRLAKTADGIEGDLKTYVEGLKTGYNTSVEVGFFWDDDMGVGLRLSDFRASNGLSGAFQFSDETYKVGYMYDDTSIIFVAPSFIARYYSQNRKTIFHFSGSIGYLRYVDRRFVVDEHINISGSTVGMGLDAGVDFKLGKNLALGLGFGFTGGALRKLEWQEGSETRTVKLEEENYENLTRLDLSAGLRWIW